MSEFNDAMLEAYAVGLFDTIETLPLTIENIREMIKSISIIPSFLQDFVEGSIILHLETNEEDAETLWNDIKNVIVAGVKPNVLIEAINNISNLPKLPLIVRNDIADTLLEYGDEEDKSSLNAAYNKETRESLEEALEGVNQAIFIFEAYRPYFDEVIPRFQTSPMLQGLNKSKEAIKNNINRIEQ